MIGMSPCSLRFLKCEKVDEVNELDWFDVWQS